MWSDPRFSEDLVTFTEEILNGKLHFLSSVSEVNYSATNKILEGKELLRKSLDTSRKCEICYICPKWHIVISFVATNCQYLINLFARAVERKRYAEAVIQMSSVE